MHSDIRRGHAMLQSAARFGADHPLDRPNARAAFLFQEVGSAAEDIQSMGGTQEASRNRFRGGASERQFVAAAIRHLMRQIARVAKVLDAPEYAEARAKLQVPRSNGYTPLLMRAAVFLETVPAIKTAFTERGMPPDFDIQLRKLITQFDVATRRKYSALSRQVGSTAAMKARLREAVRAVRELDVILSLLLQNDQPLYAAWRSASHIERAPRRNREESIARDLDAADSSSVPGDGEAVVASEIPAIQATAAESPNSPRGVG